MLRKVLWGTMCACALSVGGCSKGTQTVTGDINDPVFQESKPQIESAIALAVGAVDQTIDYSFHPPSDTAAPVTRGLGRPAAQAAVDTFAYSYDLVTGWHVAYAVFSDSGISGYVRDSVQFRDANSAFQQTYDSAATDFIWMKQGINLATDDTSAFQASLSALFDLNVSGLTGEVATANGSAAVNFQLTLVGDSGSCTMGYHFAHSLAGVRVGVPASETSGVCPLQGMLDLAGTVSVVCTGNQGNQTANAEWTVHVSFNANGTMNVTAQSGNTIWTYSGPSPCGNYENPV